MFNKRIQQARTGALMIGTVAALAACSSGGDKTAAGDSALATTSSTAAGALDSAGGGAAASTTAGGDSAMGAAGAAMGDAGIAGTINTSNAAEIGTSELAATRASSREVKSYASDMIKEHRQMQKEGDQLAQKNKLTAQPGADADKMQQQTTATIDSLKALKGAEFDQKYMAFQVQAHQMTLDKLKGFQNQAQNADLKAMVTKAIPAVQQHLERAQKIQSGLAAAPSGAAPSKS